MADETLLLYTTEDCARFTDVQGRGGDVEFPDPVRSWTDVLDCRVEPYTDNSLAENCRLAHHVRKKYILVTQSQVSREDPTA